MVGLGTRLVHTTKATSYMGELINYGCNKTFHSTFHNLYGIDPQWLEWCIPDASDTGYGGYRMQHGDHVAQAS